MSISGKAKLAGVIGWPVAQSLSPCLHSYWLREYGIDGAYVPLPVRPEDFSTALRGLRLSGFKGVSVTVPHKEAAFAFADRLDATAASAGAVNQLVFHDDGSVDGLNTDVGGLMASLDGLSLKGKPVVLIGAGGAARAAVLALDQFGASEIRILNRHSARTETLAALLSPAIAARLAPVAPEDWPKAASDAALIVNATSAGMKGAPPLDLPLDTLNSSATVCDIVYNPLETDLLKRARARGLKTIDGLGMLMHQAVPAFRAFYGIADGAGEADEIRPLSHRPMLSHVRASVRA
jgi:shikimate dehydrogenase